MSLDFDAAEERARLAAADLSAAADQVIALRTLRVEDSHDEVDAAVLSRRFTSYARSGQLDDARHDLDFASRARTEIGIISAAQGALETGGARDAVTAEAKLIGRLLHLADDCQRRAIHLRS